MKRIILDGNNMQTREAAHKYLKTAMGFPDYYGGNLDALYDCLTDICAETEVIINNYSTADQKILGVFMESKEENPQLQVELFL